MDAIWSARRYGDHFDLLTNKGKQILKAASSKTVSTRTRKMKSTSGSSPNTCPEGCLGDPCSHSIGISEVEELSSDQPLCPPVIVKSKTWSRGRPMDVVFRGISARLGGHQILQNISGQCRPGEVLAIMGPSGSGKTSLLDVLSGRYQDSNGIVTIGGRTVNRKNRHLIGYATQHDIFHTELTLRKTLEYTARLRLPESMSYFEKMASVDNIIDLLDLNKCQYTVIGDASKRGLSGGEKKRATIACEMLTNPPILFLDEPTSGLDSSAAASLMGKLKNIAKDEKKTIIVTLHQPSSQIFYMMDRILLLYNGKIAFSGETSKVVRNLEDLGLHLSPHYNPADFLLEALTDNKTCDVLTESHAKSNPVLDDSNCHEIGHSIYQHPTHINQRLESNPQCTMCEREADTNNDVIICVDNLGGKLNNNKNEDNDSGRESCADTNDSKCSCEESQEGLDIRWSSSFCTQLQVLTSRNFAVSTQIVTSRINWIQTIGLGLMAGLLWYQAQRTEQGLHDIQGWIFFSTTYWMMHSHFQVLNTFPRDWNVVKKERQSGSYRMSSYYLAKTISELPLTMILPSVYLLISYPMMGSTSVYTTSLHLVMLILNSLVAQSVGLLISVACMNFELGTGVSALVVLFMQLFGGFLSTNMKPWLSRIKYLSMVNYAYHNMNIIEFTSGIPILCSPENSKFSGCENSTYVPVEEILSSGDEEFLPLWINTSCLLVYLVIARLLAYIIIRLRNQES